MYEIKIRRATTEDAGAVCEICSEDLGYPCEESFVKEKIEKLDDDREAVYVAVVNDTVAGYVHVEKYDTLYFETMANLLGLAVKDEYRHKGIGKELVLAAEAWAAQNGIKTMRLNSGASRTDAHDFYRHLGYDLEKEQIRFMKRLNCENCLLEEK